jgi:hypothetical protein
MSIQILPASSLRSVIRLPAGRVPFLAPNYLIYLILWSIGWAIFGVLSNFLPVLREGVLPGRVEQGADHRRAGVRVILAESAATGSRTLRIGPMLGVVKGTVSRDREPTNQTIDVHQVNAVGSPSRGFERSVWRSRRKSKRPAIRASC